MVDIVLAVGTFALLVAGTSADLDESPCFIPPVEPLVVNNWTLEPFEFQPSYIPSFYNKTGVTVRATKYYQSWRGRYYVDGMFLFKALRFSGECAPFLSNSQFWCYCRHVKNCAKRVFLPIGHLATSNKLTKATLSFIRNSTMLNDIPLPKYQ